MNWKQLLNAHRLGDPKTTTQYGARNDYQRDFDRVVFSTPFRRMDGKTQVFPLPESDTTHNRLTHSLEVSCVGRSLGRIAGETLVAHGLLPEESSSIVAAASLAHDLGNPPFGHSGEAAIADFFERSKPSEPYLAGLTEDECADFTRFEGNALGFRILARTKPLQSDRTGGMQLTLATLGAFSKYPRPSLPMGKNDSASGKKFGYFQSEKETFELVANSLGLVVAPDCGWRRHPLAFLMEAADDICYRILDLEDGFRLKLVSFERTQELLQAVADLTPSPTTRKLDRIWDRKEKISYLRAKAINNLVMQVAEVFVANEDAILAGEYDKPLLMAAPAYAETEAILTESKQYIYSHRPVVEIETAGYRVLGGLLEDFLDAALEFPRSKRSKKVISLIGPEYLGEAQDNQYECVMGITEFIASMTDAFAISCYRMLRGIELPTT